MFQVNDIVLYNQTDVYRVQGIQSMPFLDQGRMDYYVLKPIYEDSPSNSTVYVPVDADSSRLHKAFSAAELQALLDEGGRKIAWIDAPTIRKKEYNALLNHGQPQDLIGLIRMLCNRREEKARRGLHMGEADEKLLLNAEKRLYPLFRYTLNVNWNDFLKLVTGERTLDLAAVAP